MAHTKSAKKRARQSQKRRLRNKAYKSRIKTFEKKYLELLDTGKLDEAKKMLKEVFSAIDKATKAGVIHWATGDRKKSRLASKLSNISKASTPSVN